jgi:orotidine-5'-phosphate decarboxylase
MNSISDKIILALDTSEAEYTLEIVDKLIDYISIVKVGYELFMSCGPGIIEEINKRNLKVFLDLKFHDIPNTVSMAALAAVKMGVFMFNIHASGGTEMMRKCRDKVVESCLRGNYERPKILGVTVLTSMADEVLKGELGIHHSIRTHVRHLAAMSMKAGLDGVVASAQDAAMIKHHCGKGFLVVSPGIRPPWAPLDDQKRTMGPKEALREGADFIVLGRAVLHHTSPKKALEIIMREISGV